MKNISQDKILILDFGSQYSQLIARRVRELNVYCELHPFDMSAEHIREFSPKGIILSGGPNTVTADWTPRVPEIIFQLGVPILGICYGMQTLAAQLAGKVEIADHREFGYAQVRQIATNELFANIEKSFDVWMSHGDHVTELPDGFEVIASTDNAAIAAMANKKQHYYGVQFHPEVTHTPEGKTILANFVHQICQCESLWTPSHIVQDAINQIRKKVASEHVILGLSGGVDSSVVAALLHQAIGKQLTCVFVDNGLLRLNEAEQVLSTFAKHMGIDIIHVNAAEEFYAALANESDPEKKRKIIGNLFIELFQREAKKLPQVKWLAQGTIYPDVIESADTGSGTAQVIKSHHNVGGLPEKMDLKLLEPLRECFKDEVRSIGVELGLANELVYRHPFPGPGLGVRILGEVKPAYAECLRFADDIFISELHKHDLYYKVSQAFAVFLPVKSVGVIGDARQYEYVIALRAIETVDFMTAHWAHLPHEFLAHVANRIINEVKGISRVVYDISGKPPATIEWE